MADEQVDLVHETKNYKMFPHHQLPYHCLITFFTASLTAAIMNAGAAADSILCGLANAQNVRG